MVQLVALLCKFQQIDLEFFQKSAENLKVFFLGGGEEGWGGGGVEEGYAEVNLLKFI